MKTFQKYLSVCLTLCLLLTAVCIFPATAQTNDGYVWVVRSLTLAETDFTADTAQVGNIWFADYHGGTAPGNIAYDKLELYCDGVKIDTIDMSAHAWNKGDSTATFCVSGSAVIAKGDHVLLFKVRVKATDVDTSLTSFFPFQLTGTGFNIAGGGWVVTGSNTIGCTELQEGTAGYNDEIVEPGEKTYVRVSRTWSVTEEQYTGDSGMLNFNCSIEFTSTVCPADVDIKALEIVCDGELIHVQSLDVSYTKGQALETSTVSFNPWDTVSVAKGDHTFIFTFVLSVENADAAWANHNNGLPLMIWSPAISNGAGIWVANGSAESPLISVSEMINGSATAAPYMENGASVRLAEDTGLRFETVISKAYYDTQIALHGADKVKVGTLIAPAVYVKEAGAFTKEALDAITKSSVTYLDIPAGGFYATDSNTYTIAGSVLNIMDTHYTLDFAAIGYIEINGVRTYASAYVVRNIAEVAAAALTDTKAEQTTEYAYAVEGQTGVFSPYTKEERALLAGFCN